MATFLPKGQIPERLAGQTTCIHHKGKELESYCYKCRQPICSKCLSDMHYCHSVCELKEHIPKRKQELRFFIDKIENNDFVQIDKQITSVDNSMQGNDRNFQKIYKKLRKHAGKLKQKIDQILDETLTMNQQIEEDNTNLLETYKHDLEMYSEYLRQKVEECKILLQYGFDIEIYETDYDVCSVSLPEAPRLNTASFSPNRNPHGCLKEAFGNHNTSNQGQTSSGHDVNVESFAVDTGPSSRQPRSDSEVKATPSQPQSIEEEVIRPGYTLLPQTKILREWESPCDISSICPTTDGRAWTCFRLGNTLSHLDRKGKIVQEVKHNTKIIDISLSPTTNRLWACDEDNNILELESGQLKTRFSTSTRPLSICITASEHVIIGIDNKIAKFTRLGELVRKTEETEGRFVTWPWRMSECPVTHNIAVVNIGRDVVIFDNDLQELFVYTGDIPNVYRTTTGDGPFYPLTVVYDSVGNLVIGDDNNKRLLLISGRGQFIRIIHTDDRWSRAVGIDRQGVLFGVYYLGNIKLLQYNDMYTEDKDEYKEDSDEYVEDNNESMYIEDDRHGEKRCCVLL